MTARPIAQLITQDGVNGDVFDGRDLIGTRQGLAAPGVGYAAFDHTEMDPSCCRIRQDAAVDGRAWSVQVWVTVLPRNGRDVRLTTTTFLVTDGVHPVAVAFAFARSKEGRVSNSLLQRGLPGLTGWLRKRPPHARPPWDRIMAVHQVLTRAGGVPPFALQAASHGVTDPDLVNILELARVDPGLLPVPPSRSEPDPTWMERVILWIGVFPHADLVIRLMNANAPATIPSAGVHPNLSWAGRPEALVAVAAAWASSPGPWSSTPSVDALPWVFSMVGKTYADPLPVDYVLEAHAGGWTAEEAGWFFRFHQARCQRCRRQPSWPHARQRVHGHDVPTLFGWAPLMPAALAARCVAAGHTLQEVESWSEFPSSQALAVSAALNGVTLPAFAH